MQEKRRRHTRGLITVLICLGLVALAAGAVTVSGNLRRDKAEAQAAAAKPAGAPAVNVRVQELKPAVVEDRVLLTGGIQPWESVTISAEVSGKVEWKGIEEGQRVQAGAEIMRIDTEILQAQLEELAARHRLAEQELNRIQQLRQKGAISSQELDRASAERDVVAANMRAARITLKKSVIVAPMDGVIDKLFIKQHEFVDVGKPLVRIVQVDRVKALIGIPERDVPYFEEGDPVRITVDAHEGKIFEGRIYRLATTAEASTRTFAAEIAITNEEGLLRPGMIARGTFVRQTFPDSLLVPIYSVISLEDRRFVYVEKGGQAQVRPISIGVLQNELVQVISGLKPGEHLIIAGQRDVRPGGAVTVRND